MARRRWLIVAVCVLAAAGLVLGWVTLQADRRDGAAQPLPTSASTDEAEQGVLGGGLATPSNPLGTPVPAPEPESDDPADGSPIGPWWRRVPPVAGEVVPLNRWASGHVRISRTGEHLLITIEDLRVESDHEVSSVRVLLSEGEVVGRPVAYWSAHGDDDEELGVVPADVGTITFDLESPRGMPAEVRSLVLIDADAGDVLGGAALLPTD